MAFTPVRNIYGNLGVTIRGGLQVADSQTINIGDLLQTDSNGRLTVVTEAPTLVVGSANEALTTTTATTADVISVTLARDTVFRASFSTTGSKTTFQTTDLYVTAYDSLDKTSVDPNDTTGGFLWVQGWNNTLNWVDVAVNTTNLANVY